MAARVLPWHVRLQVLALDTEGGSATLPVFCAGNRLHRYLSALQALHCDGYSHVCTADAGVFFITGQQQQHCQQACWPTHRAPALQCSCRRLMSHRCRSASRRIAAWLRTPLQRARAARSAGAVQAPGALSAAPTILPSAFIAPMCLHILSASADAIWLFYAMICNDWGSVLFYAHQAGNNTAVVLALLCHQGI